MEVPDLVDDDLLVRMRKVIRKSKLSPGVTNVFNFDLIHKIDRDHMGDITVRLGSSDSTEIQGKGHLGYAVKPLRRGKNFAARGVTLLLPFLRQQGVMDLIVVMEKGNLASQRVAEKFGAALLQEFTVSTRSGPSQRLRYGLQLQALPESSTPAPKRSLDQLKENGEDPAASTSAKSEDEPVSKRPRLTLPKPDPDPDTLRS